MSGSAAAWMKSSRRIKYSMQICDNISKGLSGLCFFFVGVFEMVMFEREVFQDSVSSQCSGQSRLSAPRTTNRKSHQLGIDCSQRESSFIFQIPQKRRSFLYGLRANVLIFDSTAPNFGKKKRPCFKCVARIQVFPKMKTKGEYGLYYKCLDIMDVLFHQM